MWLSKAIEKRALTENDWLLGVLGGQPTASGATVNADTAVTISAVFAAIRIIAGTVASLPLMMYERLERGKRRAQEYPLYELLHDQPNEEQTALEFRDMLQGHLCLRGNAYYAIERKAGWPVRLVPLHPDNVRVRRAPNGELLYEWSPKNQDPRTFRPRLGEIGHLRSLSKDGVTGMSVVELAREGMGMALSLEEHGARLFKHGAQFSGMLKYPGKLGQDKLDSLRKDFSDKYAGSKNAWKPIILESGMDWVTIGMNSHDAEFLASRKFQIADVSRWFLIPPHMIGDTERSTSWGTGIEQQTQGFLTYTMGYWFRLWELAIRRDLIPQEDRQTYFAEFIVAGLLRGDTAARGSFYNQLFMIGALSPNDIRELENMNPIDGGDHYYVPLNEGQIDAPPANTDQPSDEDDDAVPE